MATPALALPPARDAVHPDDVVGIERWAAAQQAQLRLLQRELAAAQAAATSASEAVASRRAGDGPAGPPELQPQLASAVAQQARRFEAEVEAAQAAAVLRISDAVREATDRLLVAGFDADSIRRITRPAAAPPRPAVDPTAASEPDRGRAAAGAPQLRGSVLAPETPPEPAAGGSDRIGPSVVVDLTRTWHPFDGGDHQAFDLFWGDVLDERPVRDRLRRWVQRQEQ